MVPSTTIEAGAAYPVRRRTPWGCGLPSFVPPSFVPPFEMDSRRSTARARPGPDLDSPSTRKMPLQSGEGWSLATGRGYKTAWVSPGGTAHNEMPPHIRSVLNADSPAIDATPADVEASPDGSWLLADGSTVYHMGAGW